DRIVDHEARGQGGWLLLLAVVAFGAMSGCGEQAFARRAWAKGLLHWVAMSALVLVLTVAFGFAAVSWTEGQHWAVKLASAAVVGIAAGALAALVVLVVSLMVRVVLTGIAHLSIARSGAWARRERARWGIREPAAVFRLFSRTVRVGVVGISF